jgi:hypothetical protein
VVVAPSCTAEGSRGIKCTKCDEVKIVGAIAKDKHNYVTLSEAIAPTCEAPGKSESKLCVTCGNKSEVTVYEALGHKDADKDKKCDNCDAQIYGGSKYCKCLCHNESVFMKFIYRIIKFFWKLFKINRACECGFKHY